MKAAFQTLRHNATRRGKVFTITFDYFKRFCYRTNYMAGKGRTKESYSIDRHKNELGYIPGNIKCRTLSFNSSKGARPVTKILNYDWRTKYATVI